jgi:hypothetical protein
MLAKFVRFARRTQIINCLVEGSSIRSTERMTDTHRDTIMRLLVEVGAGCAKLMDEQMRELPCRRIQVDEIWAYVGKKQAHLTRVDDRSRLGDMWTFVALQGTTRLFGQSTGAAMVALVFGLAGGRGAKTCIVLAAGFAAAGTLTSFSFSRMFDFVRAPLSGAEATPPTDRS